MRTSSHYHLPGVIILLQLYNGIFMQITASAFMENGLFYKIIHVSAGRRLSSFSSYRDVVLTEFNVPSGLVSGMFGFSTLTTPKGCAPDKTVKAIVQHGGYPLYDTGAYGWSEGVYANRSDTVSFEFPANESIWKIIIPAPREGPWFSAVFIKEPTDHIKQSGLYTKCEITYFASLLASEYQDEIINLNSAESFTYRGREGDRQSRQMFRMALMEDRVDVVEVLVQCIRGCPSIVRARSGALPNPTVLGNSTVETRCWNGTCRLMYFPLQHQNQYVEVIFRSVERIAFNLTITAIPCIKRDFLNQIANFIPPPENEVRAERRISHVIASHSGELLKNRTTQNSIMAVAESSADEVCPFVMDMSRLEFQQAFTSSYGLNHFTWPNIEYVLIPTNAFSDTILRFPIERYRDSGGTLFVALNFTQEAVEELDNLTVVACLNLGAGPRFGIETSCQGPLLLLNSSVTSTEVLVPYPEAGMWYLNIQGRPSVDFDPVLVSTVPLRFVVKIDQCVKGSCGPHGSCRVSLNSGILIVSACVCQAGWKGWDCSDSSDAESSASLFVAVFFLTISNLFFIPAAIVAARRKYFAEGIVYAATCFFSSFYHACDQPSKNLTFCIMDFGVLQFCDFYVSILSFWMTIIAMADLPFQLRSVAQMAGCIGIALGVEYEKTGLWVFAVPALSAVFVLFASWSFRSYRMKRLNPHKNYWLLHFLPGFVFAALGLILFAFVETKSNYKFVHSIWHIAMALSVICFLPPLHHRTHGKYPNLRMVSAESSISTTTVATANGNPTQDPLNKLETPEVEVTA